MTGYLKLKNFPYWHELVLASLLAGLILWSGWVEPGFISVESQVELSTHIWELAFLALPMTLIIITAGIDLSVGSTLALCAVVLGLSFEAGLPPGYGAVLALFTGIIAGGLNGFFIAHLRIHPLIVTLASMAAFRGVAEGISQARPISGFPESFAFIGRGKLLGLPLPGLIFIAFALVAILILVKTPLGRYIYAIGHNETASRFSGIPVKRIKFLLYSISGMFAGMAALILVARRNTAKADLGLGMELDVITAVVLGGSSIFGGRGSISGTILGVLLIHQTREFVSWHWNSEELNLIVIGVLLILSVLMHKALSKNKLNNN
jgi:ribose/xylose/arabinose/galactoside ABC-type transport system permease subunit